MFFLERKNQRTFPMKLRSRPRARSPMCKVFLLLFLQKKKDLVFLFKTTIRHEFPDGF